MRKRRDMTNNEMRICLGKQLLKCSYEHYSPSNKKLCTNLPNWERISAHTKARYLKMADVALLMIVVKGNHAISLTDE